MTGPILLATGGTGGHIFPAEAVAAELSARGRRLVVVTDRRGGDFGRRFGDIPIYRISAGTPSATGIVGKTSAIVSIAIGTCQAWLLCRRLLPAAVIGFGGYPSLPTMLASVLRRVPRAIHEQNAVLGRVNRLLARRVDAIATSFPRVRRVPDDPSVHIVETGNPVRSAIAALCGHAYRPPEADDTVNLLVFGGSQGASIFAEAVPAAVGALPENLRRRVRVVQQARPEDVEKVRRQYADMAIEAEVSSFFDDMPAYFGEAHLVISRAGAGTVSELAAAGRPAVLVPYAFATDNHQTWNAQALVDAGGAKLIRQDDLTAENLAAILQSWLGNPEALTAAAQAAAGCARPDAAQRLADLAERLADTGRATAEMAGAAA